MPRGPFQLPLALDLAAVFVLAITGALVARRKGFDFVGIGVLALVAGLGGAILRDGVFLQAGPPAVIRDARYLLAVLGGAIAGAWFATHLDRLALFFQLADAVGLGLYGAVGAQKATEAGLPFLGALLVASVNAVGGSVLRDLLFREVPLLFRPGEFYAVAAVGGAATFLALARFAGVPDAIAAIAGIGVCFGLRVASLTLGWRTTPLPRGRSPDEG